MAKPVWKFEPQALADGTTIYRPIVQVVVTPIRGSAGEDSSKTQGPALIDTGAGISAIDEKVAKDFGFRVIGKTSITVADGTTKIRPVYETSIRITRLPKFSKPFKIAGLPLQATQDIIAIVGRDILEHGSLQYDGTRRVFRLDLS